MDELKEAEEILVKVQKYNPERAIIYLHQAELQIHKREYHLACALLKKAQKMANRTEIIPFQPNIGNSDDISYKGTSEEITRKKNLRKLILERRKNLKKSNERQLSANIFSLLGKRVYE